MQAVLAGDVQLTAVSVNTSMPHIRSGRVKALAIASLKRSPALPEVRTLAEQGVHGAEADSWLAIFGPPGIPEPLVAAEKLKSYGFSIAIYPSSGMGPACAALRSSYAFLLKNGSTEGSPVPAYDMKQLHELVGFQDVWDFEKRHVEVK